MSNHLYRRSLRRRLTDGPAVTTHTARPSLLAVLMDHEDRKAGAR